ncbi:MAG: RNA small subunit methyltransferase H [Methylocystaceae bacterium]|nr:MAG: RNA small subunit methyltransferase H [Methylocystaceae bacterium]KAF0209865.1 MAG: RNA small subunit methyltransferase [Methylocystaceae bacterium]TXT43337.1 MAG: RNA small subunit methyltransferase H [Methylocystaceae bacterium]
MTHQAIRVSLILWQRLLKSLNAAVFTGMLCVGLYALVTNFAEARGAIGKAFVKLTQIQSFEGFNVKAAFAVDQIAESTPIYHSLPAEMRGMLPDDILSLRANWVERILYVGDQGKLCDFASANQKMNEDYAADRHLAADGLITMKDSREVKAQVLEDMRQAKARNDAWPNGEPRFCYVTELTERGRNVKTALAQFLRAGFAAATGAPAAPRDPKLKVAGMAQ